MAIEYTTNKQSFTGAVDVIQFTFQIPYFETSDINVTREDTDGTITKLTYAATPVGGDQFKVDATNNNPADGGRITLGTDSTVGSVYTIERIVPLTQQYDLQNGSTIDPAALNKALDRVVAQNQQQNDNLTKSIVFPVTDPDTTTYDVSATTSRANKALGFDASGSVTELDIAQEGGFAVNSNAGLDLQSGQLSAKVDNSTTQFSGGNIAVKTVGTSQIADGSITFSKLGSDVNLTEDILQDHTYVQITQGTGGGGVTSSTKCVITGGISKTFYASNSGNNAALTIQSAINAIPKNLNGYNVYFQFGLLSPSPTHIVKIESVIDFNHFTNGVVVIESKNTDDYADGASYAKTNRLESTGTSIQHLIGLRSCSDVVIRGLHLEQSTGTTNYKSVVYTHSLPYISIYRCYVEGITNSSPTTNPSNGGDQRGVMFDQGTVGRISDTYVNNVRFGIEVRQSCHIYAENNNDISNMPAYGNRVQSGFLQPTGTAINGSTADYQTVNNGLVVNSGAGNIITTIGNL